MSLKIFVAGVRFCNCFYETGSRNSVLHCQIILQTTLINCAVNTENITYTSVGSSRPIHLVPCKILKMKCGVQLVRETYSDSRSFQTQIQEGKSDK